MTQLSGIAPGDWITIGAHRRPGARCLVRPDGDVLSYAEVAGLIDRLASALRRNGIGRGDRIAVLATDSVEYMVIVFASFKLGTVLVPVNYRLADPEIDYLLETARPAAVFLEARYAGQLDRIRARSPRLIVGIDDCPGADHRFDDFVAGRAPSVELVSETLDDDILCLIMTSGTTGRPKTARHSQRMLKANTVKGVVEQGFRPDDLVYAGPPLFHVAGIGFTLYGLSRGAGALLLSQFEAPTLLSWMRPGGVTRLMLVPSMLSGLLGQPELGAADFSGIRSIAYGGSPMPPSMLRRIHDVFDCDLYNTFGAATEGGGQTVLRPEDHVRAFNGEPHLLRSIGRAQYGIDLRLCDPNGADVPPGEIGEIWTRSDTVMSGYLDDQALTDSVIIDGWFHGGDMAWRDDEGFLYLVGRADDMIIRGGENIYPVEIEAVIRQHPSVLDATVLGVPDEHWGQRVVVALEVDPASRPTATELRTQCRQALAGYKVPDRWFVLDQLPRNSTGKTDMPTLREVLALGNVAELSIR